MPTPTPTALLTGPHARAERLERRNQQLRDAFYQRYTNQPRGRKPSREAVVAALADEYCLSVKTIEKLLYVSR